MHGFSFKTTIEQLKQKMSIITATTSTAPAATKAIFSPIKVGNNNLKHRVVLAP